MRRSEMLKLIADFVETEFEPRTIDGLNLSHAYAVSLLDLLDDYMEPAGCDRLHEWEPE